MDLGNGLGHLTYSTLVHPGDTWDEMWSSLTTYVPQVKARVAPDEPFGVSLRLSAASARTLAGDAERRAELRSFLDDNDLYLYTVNAFPFGPFKGRVVKEEVYEPDWSHRGSRAVHDRRGRRARGRVARRHPAVDPDRAARVQAERHGARRRRGVHATGARRRRASRAARAAHRPHGHPRDRARAVLLPRDHRRDGRVLPGAPLLGRRCARARRGRADPRRGRSRRPAPPPRHRVRHLPPGRRIRGHHGLPRCARRRRRPDPQAAGGGCPRRPGGDAGRRGGAASLRGDRVPHADAGATRRPAHPVSQPGGRVRGLGRRSRPACVAHPHSRAGVPRRSRAVPLDAVRDRGRASRPSRDAACPVSSRSRPTRGTCSRRASRPGTSSSTSAARSNGCAAGSCEVQRGRTGRATRVG